MTNNPKHRGEKSEAHIIAAALERGFSVSIPFGNNQRYDLILDDGEELLKVQCKTGWMDDGRLAFSVISRNGFTGERKGYKGQIDLFLVYSPDTKKVYRVAVGDVPTNQMMLRIAPMEKIQRKGVNWAKDFEF